LVKHQGWGFTIGTCTLYLLSQAPRKPCKSTLRGIFREHNFIKFADMPCGGCECMEEGGCMQWCGVGVRSRRCKERVTGNTKSTRVGHAVRPCRCRRREPMIERGNHPSMVVANPTRTRNSQKHRNCNM